MSPALKGLFGKGKDHACKPSRFEIALGPGGLPVVSAFLSALPEAAQFSSFGSVPIFQYCPRLDDLGHHDLSIGWAARHAELMAALDRGDHYKCGYTAAQVADMRAQTCTFCDPPRNAVFFGLDVDAIATWSAMRGLGFAPPRGSRGSAGALARAPAEERPEKRRGRADSDDDGPVWVPDQELDEDEPGAAEDSLSDLDSIVARDDPVYVIEDWVDRKFDDDEQENAYLIQYCGYDEPEWTLERRINGRVPRRIDEAFDMRDRKDEQQAASERKARSFRAAAQRAIPSLADDEEVPAVASAVPAAAPAPTLVSQASSAGPRAHLKRDASRKK